MLRSTLFVAARHFAARLPRFRGRNRAVLSLLPALGLKGRHIVVDATLTEPTTYRARLDMHSWLQRMAFVNDGYEAETVRMLLRLLGASPGYLLDVGANIGLIAIPAALLSRQHVVAIEAVPDNVAAFRHNMALNRAEDLIDLVPTATGDVAGRVDIQVEGNLKHGEGSGTANILALGSTYECERIQIEVTTIDDLLSSGRIGADCGVMKIDTDGYDLKVLYGARSLLGRCRPVIFGEFAAGCLAWHGQTVDDVQRFATDMDYEVWAATEHDTRRFSRSFDSASFQQDLLLVPSEKSQAVLRSVMPSPA
jgi:FkbM family methyltransferase